MFEVVLPLKEYLRSSSIYKIIRNRLFRVAGWVAGNEVKIMLAQLKLTLAIKQLLCKEF